MGEEEAHLRAAEGDEEKTAQMIAEEEAAKAEEEACSQATEMKAEEGHDRSRVDPELKTKGSC